MSFYNCLLITEHLNKNLPSPFSGYFTYMADLHNHNTRGGLKKLVNVPYSKTSFYGTHSITAISVKNWNNLQNKVVFVNEEPVSTPKLNISSPLTVTSLLQTNILEMY